jgi:hypothetical protein
LMIAAASNSGGISPLRVQIVIRAGTVRVRKFGIRVISLTFDRSASESHA